ncbi:mRNA transport regulator [Coccidioides immitis RS]|uniref:mRNA transport regulator n=3 Tax=Coccidioides immitis TaxID=5501 RepID=J3K4Y8_COCIM|nr:mRNA transport regulator [Coccidioides immitis RS]EAS29419.3 mRNA transport regulator [Coccidioides immitis RS]KMP06562.1 karyopherin [Coccidioides immitis RMSCC 2394]KMU84132.1 karyopherin [Coccidioides immitis H538.4]TPX22496.1 Nuclear import receptor [Coccidioides immitis]
MATKSTAPVQEFAPVLAALATMQGNASRQEKTHAHEFLERFQKSVEAWTTTHAILQAPDSAPEAKLFAATTLKGKITYDLDQLPESSLPALRTSILSLLANYRLGPRPIQTQLCVCLASLAIQMITWKDVLPVVGSALGNEASNCILEFLKILPEEVTEGRKINLTEEELATRTKELLEDNADQVLALLTQYSQSSPTAASNPQLLECITSWMREIPASRIANSPLMDVIVKALSDERSFDAAVECMCAIYRDTLEVDDSMPVIQTVYPRLIALRPKIREAAETEDPEMLRGVTRLFAEAAEAWVVLIARLPNEFRNLVEAVLECCVVDKERDAISITFVFWFELKQYVTLDRYANARIVLSDVFSKLVDIMIKHLEFPATDGDEEDLFEGDREQEEKFREFRHAMGDVLKDCCAVIGVSECLNKSYDLIQGWVAKYGPQASHNHVPHWQELEAPLFSMRAMGRMVDPEESSVLPQIIPLIVRIPDQEKVRFQAIMALGRYTEWTAQHPETLEAQLNYVISGFQHKSQEVVQAAALAFRFLGTDCQKLLGGHIPQLHTFYESVIDNLKPSSQEEVTEGVAAVVAVQPIEKIYETLKLFCDPIMRRIMNLANNAKDEDGQRAVADHLQLITIFIQIVSPYVDPGTQNPGVRYCEEILPVLSTIVLNFTKSTPILERVCRCWRYMIISYRNAMIPLLPNLAQSISAGFQASREGCFLWATDAVVREFSSGAEYVDQATSDAVYHFFEQQVIQFLRILNDLPPNHLPDMIEDFFRLLTDAVRYFPKNTLTSQLAVPIFSAALSALTLQQVDPLTATLHYCRDVLSFGFEQPSISEFTSPEGEPFTNPPEVRAAVKQLISSQGSLLVQRVMTGMMFTFPGDCFPDASGVLMALFELLPQETATWVGGTIQLLPSGTLKPGESERLMKNLSERVQTGDHRKIRTLLQDFTNSYRRRNVAPREGLGRLEAARFRFTG